jgi:D-glycerate 3-kinase
LTTSNANAEEQLKEFCRQQDLPKHYFNSAKKYFLPLAKDLAERSNKNNTLLIGINGCQGSGKSTLALLLTLLLSENYGLAVANLSIDDFYYTLDERKAFAKNIHPLFKTRGVPGTHDITLLQQTLDNLRNSEGKIKGKVSIPRFNKATDDRYPSEQWDQVVSPADIILLEGWCVGVTSQKQGSLLQAINKLELNEDPKAIWRQTVNEKITLDYEDIFKQMDMLIMLQAPSFDCVYQWRTKQEQKLRQRTGASSQNKVMNKQQLERFIHHYQRLTEHMLETLPAQADIIFQLNPQHEIDKRITNEFITNE